MTTKKVVKKGAEKVGELKTPVPTKNVNIPLGATDEESFKNAARVLTGSGVAAYRVISASLDSKFIDSSVMVSCLSEQAAKVVAGDLSQVEGMLVNQAVALQVLFSKLAERGMGCETNPAFEINMRVALRAQSQCRATLETLAAIKNPPIVYAKQANISSGHQQVNNGSHPREIEIAQSKLSSNVINGLRIETNELLSDTGTQALKSGTDTKVETLGKVYGAKVAGGKG